MQGSVAEWICPDCGKHLFHENETTLDVEKVVHNKFCRKKEGAAYSFMHRKPDEKEPIDAERATDEDGNPILKR
ncbi:MAG: hypothetical protein ACE5JT_04330 [Nitrosopumilaceae archaeon]